MKKLGIIGLFLVGMSGPLSAVTGNFKLKNDSPREIYYMIEVGSVPRGDRSDLFKRLGPGQTATETLTALQLPTYVGIWEVYPKGLRVLPVQGGVTFSPQATKIYTFKPGQPIDVYWTGEKLRPTGTFGRLTKRLFGTVRSIPFIPQK